MRYCLFILLISFNFSCYSLRQAYQFSKLYSSRSSIEDLEQDPKLDPKIRAKFRYLKKILSFAESQGLDVEGAYVDYIHLDTGQVSFLVQAAKKDELKFKTWWFPFVGTVPYLGFFKESDRDEEYSELAKSYDVSKSKVGAFSSLGWFEDPVFTSMLNRNKENMAHLFFHELVHRTLWSSGSTRFNENLAEFCAEKMVDKFFSEQGENTRLVRYYQKKRDKQKFKSWLLNLKSDLKKVYSDSTLSYEKKLVQKSHVIKEYQVQLLPDFETKSYKDYIALKSWNNASILGASLYTPDTQRFERAYRCLGEPSIGLFLGKLEVSENHSKDHFDALDKICDGIAS